VSGCFGFDPAEQRGDDVAADVPADEGGKDLASGYVGEHDVGEQHGRNEAHAEGAECDSDEAAGELVGGEGAVVFGEETDHRAGRAGDCDRDEGHPLAPEGWRCGDRRSTSAPSVARAAA
jgi:hypothetical protein